MSAIVGTYCTCRDEKKPAVTVAVGSTVTDTKPSFAVKELAAVVSGTFDCRPNIVSSPSKRLSPADVSGAAEEWETASEGSDGGLHPRRLTAHREEAVKFAAAFKNSASDSVNSSRGRAVNGNSHHSPCASGVPSLSAHTRGG